MKHLLFLTLLFVSFITVGQSESAVRQIKWQKVIGWKDAETEAYVDSKSIEKVKVDNVDITRGIFLIQRKNPSVLVQPGEKPIIITSMARIVLINCDRRLVGIAADFFFNLDRLPVITDMPVRTNDYSEDDDNEVEEVETSNVVYKTLCPVYL